MRIPFFAGFGSLVTATIAAACTVSPPPPPDGTTTEFCADYAKAICQISATCVFDASACTTFQTAQCMTNVANAETGARQYNQPNGKACIDALNANGAYGGNPTTISAASLASISAICDKAVVGNVASDKPCTGDNDCSGTLVCAPYGTGKLCAAVVQKNLGDICGDPGDECQGDSYCAMQAGAAPQCVATPTAGQPCSATIPCGTSDRCQSGTCQARAGLLAACTTNDDCGPTAPYCDPYAGKCTPGLSFALGSTDCNGIAGMGGSPSDDAGAGVSTEAGE
jgi:hypothetical protein